MVKEIAITDPFLQLDKKKKGCQIEEPYNNCTNRVVLNNIRKTHGCVPFKLWTEMETLPICSSAQIKKMNHDYDVSECIPNCEGTVIVSMIKSEIPDTIKIGSLLMKQYAKYKGMGTGVTFPLELQG